MSNGRTILKVLARHVAAVALVAGITWLCLQWEALRGGRSPAPLFALAILVTAIFAGAGPALLATAISALSFTYFFLPPVGGLGVAQPVDQVHLFVLIVLGVLIGLATARMQAALQRSRSAYQRLAAALDEQITAAITENASAALFVVDEHARCIYMNPAAEAMTGRSLAELGSRPLPEVLRDPGQRTPFPAVSIASGSARHLSCEDVYVRKNGERFPVHCSVTRIDRRGRPRVVLLEVLDATLEKQAAAEREVLLESERAARAEAERANRVKDDFLATLSHELRTPLHAITGWARLVRTAPGKQGQALEVIERNAHLLAQLVSDMLDVSRIVTGKLRVDRAQVKLAPVVEAAVDALRDAAEAKQVTLSTAVDPGVVVGGDEARLQQIVWNLVSNAVKFTAPGGRVEVRLAARQDGAEITVEDDGEGIDPAWLPHLFERFWQADASAARRHGGLGLGLSIVRHLVELHGGTVRAESDGAGKGARFIVALPSESLHVALPEAARPHDHAPRPLEGTRIVVVDDEPDAKDLLQRLLEDQGAIVRTASSATEALAALSAEVPDLVVSDIGMPGVDGYEMMRRLRAHPDTRAVLAVALTAYARAEDRARAFHAGYQAHVVKPVDPRELVAAVAALIKAREAGQAAA